MQWFFSNREYRPCLIASRRPRVGDNSNRHACWGGNSILPIPQLSVASATQHSRFTARTRVSAGATTASSSIKPRVSAATYASARVVSTVAPPSLSLDNKPSKRPLTGFLGVKFAWPHLSAKSLASASEGVNIKKNETQKADIMIQINAIRLILNFMLSSFYWTLVRWRTLEENMNKKCA